MHQGDVRNKRVFHPQEAVCALRHAYGIALQVFVEEDLDLIGFEYVMVAYQVDVVEPYTLELPPRRPVVAYPVLFLLERLHEIAERFVTLLDPLYKGRIGPIYGVAKDGDKPRVGYVVLYPNGSLRIIEVQSRGLAYGLLVGDRAKQRPVGTYVGDGFTVHVHIVARPTEVQRFAFQGEELRLLHGAHVHLGVLFQVVVKRGSPGLPGAYDEEVGHRHELISSFARRH